MESEVTAVEARLAQFLDADPEAIADPYPLYSDLRAAGRAVRFRDSVYFSHYADVKAILSDDGRFSADHGRRGSRAQSVRARLRTDRERDAFDAVMGFEAHFMNRNDADTHQRLRQAAHATFTPARVAAMREAMTSYAVSVVQRMREEGSEVVDLAPVAYEFPLTVISDVIGVPLEDRGAVLGWSIALANNRNGQDADALLDAYEAWMMFEDYIKTLVARHRRSPVETGPFLADILEAREANLVGDDELISIVVQILLAGHEKTSHLIGASVLGLLQQPGAWRELCEDAGVWSSAIQELLRFVTPSHLSSRRATVRTEVGGVEVEPDETVVAIRGSANHDPAVFCTPEAIVLRRKNAHLHLAFGSGAHYCLGARLARVEGDIFLRCLAAEFPKLAVAGDVSWTGSASLRRVACLPVSIAA